MKTYFKSANKKELAGPWQDLLSDVHDWENYALIAVALCSVFTVATALITI